MMKVNHNNDISVKFHLEVAVRTGVSVLMKSNDDACDFSHSSMR
jgi:hypothetical protein